MLSEKDRYNALRVLPEFTRIKSKTLQEMAKSCSETTLQAGEKLIFNHLSRFTIFSIVSGKLSFFLKSHAYGNQALDEFGVGAFIGDFKSQVDFKGEISLVAAEQTILLSIPDNVLSPILQQYPDTKFYFDKTIRALLYRGQFALYMSSLFNFHDPKSFKELLKGITWHSLGSGQVLYRQGDPSDSIYLILAGKMRRTMDEGNGRHRLVSEMVAGETVGEIAPLTGSGRQGTVAAARDSILAELSSEGFERLTETHPQITLQIARLVATRLKNEFNKKPAKHRKGKIFVVAAVHENFNTKEFVSSLFSAMKFTGSTAYFSAKDIDKELGQESIAQEPSTSIKNIEISQWLHKQEILYENIILIADNDWSEWTERTIRQADHLLLVADSEASVEQSPLEKKLNALWDFSSHLKQSLILVHPADTEEIVGTKRWLEKRRIQSFYHVRNEYLEDFARLARIITGQANCLVLGGGGARGYAHIGVLKALEENGVPIDIVGGTSIGAIIGAAIALQYDSNKTFELCSRYFRKFFDFTLPIISLIKGRKIEENLERAIGNRQIEDLLIPFFCVSANLTRAEQVIHNKGAIKDALRASMSLPAMVPPVLQSGDLLVDGGVLNNLPIDIMNDLYAGGKIIAVDISPKVDLANNESHFISTSGLRLLLARLNPFRRKDYIPSIFDIVSRSMTLAAVNKSMQSNEKSLTSLYLLLPVDTVGTLEYQHLEKIVDLGYSSSINEVTKWCRGNEVVE
ncbi:MAG: hypothetical protein A6F71_07960 [Cycloclasticus sp. symbiont of Poecilosclerida sp. M]|nr:MAG: hypothetical protein A6F71_07960 [Cycloclasticus sp. symbiont of Poecilosclerida sp. M]